jgi:Pectinacetylesterase
MSRAIKLPTLVRVLCASALALLAVPRTTSAQAVTTGTPVAVADWTWVPLPGTRCRNGDPTGVGIRLGAKPEKVLIWVQGGGACFNAVSCAANQGAAGLAEFKTRVLGNWLSAPRSREGVFDSTRQDNPTGDYTQVFVPYCTGDFHAGNAPDTAVFGLLKKQQFVGARNMDVFLRYIAQRFAPDLQKPGAHVVFSGESAGGNGVGLNADVFAKVMRAAAIPAQLTVLSDSGGLMPLPSCLDGVVRPLWKLSASIYARCPTCQNHAEFDAWAMKNHPDVDRLYLASTNDNVARFAGGLLSVFDGCPAKLTSEEDLTRAMLSVRARMDRAAAAYGVGVGTYFVAGSPEHTWLSWDRFYTTTQDGIPMYQWLDRALNDGDLQHVGP